MSSDRRRINLFFFQANNTKDAVKKLDKAMQENRDLQKRLDALMEKLATGGEVSSHPLETNYKGRSIDDDGIFYI